MNQALVLSYLVLWVLVIVLAIAITVCIRQIGEIYLYSAGLRGIAGDGLDEGRVAPDLELKSPDGRPETLRGQLKDGGVLIFASERCHICKDLVPRLLWAKLPERVVIAYDKLPDYVQYQTIDSRVAVFELVKSNAPSKFRVRVTPFAFGLDDHLRVRTRGLVNSVEQVAYHAGQPILRPSTAN